MSFCSKVLVQAGNFMVSWWLLVVMFSTVARLSITAVSGDTGERIGSVIGLIYVSYAFTVQL